MLLLLLSPGHSSSNTFRSKWKRPIRHMWLPYERSVPSHALPIFSDLACPEYPLRGLLKLTRLSRDWSRVYCELSTRERTFPHLICEVFSLCITSLGIPAFSDFSFAGLSAVAMASWPGAALMCENRERGVTGVFFLLQHPDIAFWRAFACATDEAVRSFDEI